MKLGFKFGLATWLIWVAAAGPLLMARSSDNGALRGSDSKPATRKHHRTHRSRAASDRSAKDKDLLSAEQGEALVDFAVESAADLRNQPDCSHFVHLVYSDAGLNYAYQDSRVLRQGVPEFTRVKRPQAGDLIVWPGHVGIVTSPREKTFFSSVRSGIITESWTAAHWRARGTPRFFRYRIGPETDLAVLASVTGDGR
jgi:cell wall-associated NlpC family hydrolase